MKKRILFWDNYKGILIFLVVFGHFLYAYATKCNGSWADYLFTLIYMFHMPAFIFASGYFSKSDNCRASKSLMKLLLYYIVFNFGMMIFLYVFKGSSISLLTPYNSYWYILSLIFWRMSIKGLSKIKGIVPLSILIALLLGYWPDFSNILSIRRTVAFFPFFLLGYNFDKERFENIIKNKTLIKTLIGILLASGLSLLLLLVVKQHDITLSMLLMGKYVNSLDILYRLVIFIVSLVVIALMILVVPSTKLPFITKWGKNSLLIYLVHRFITIVFAHYYPASEYSGRFIIYGFIATLITCFVLSSEIINRFVSNVFNKAAELITSNDKKGQHLKTILIILFVLLLLMKPVKSLFNNIKSDSPDDGVVYVKPLEMDNTIKISYVGDLILLRDQVTSAYNEETKEYEFNSMFEYAKPYLESSDLAIGVLEGPLGGNETPYSTSNYGDGIKLYLNFPDAFAESIKWSGIDLVITSNNHLLDAGKEGALRTLDVLDEMEIKHTGSYRNQEEKDTLMIVEVDGVKIAFLSYLSSVNYYKTDEIVEDIPYITSIMPKTNNKYYNKLLDEIEQDFKQAKEANVDLIVVTAHMGTQFSHSTNEFQDKWNDIFIELGADIILGDHAHAVQPIEYKKDTLIINCPGNFANSYIKYDGDATSIVNIYIDKNTKKVVASSVIPMYTQQMKDGYFRALPIYDIITNKELYSEVSYNDLVRISEVQKIVTNSMLGKEIKIDNINNEYYLMTEEFYQNMTSLVELEPSCEEKEIYKLIEESNSITFIGDSITEGTKNNFHPWYEFLIADFDDKEIINISKGGYTTKKILQDYSDDILNSKSDLYVIALGTNDVRYRNKKTCAMTSEEYIKEMDKIVRLIKKSNNNAKIVLISPWMTLEDDQISKLSVKHKDAMIDEYSDALERYAKENNYLYINPNGYLREFFETNDYGVYMTDPIHPNEFLGIKLYSKAVCQSSQ